MTHAHVNGIWLNYREQGEGEPVLLVMGLGAPLQGWEPQIEAFSRRYRVLSFDNRGIGRSDKPLGPYRVAQMVEDTRALLDHRAIESAHVVGLSMGGMVAMELAARYPQRVRSLVLAATAASADARMRWTIGRSAALITAAAMKASGSIQERIEAAQEEIVRIWLPLVFSAGPGGDEEAIVRRLMSEAFAGGFPAGGAAGQLAACFSHDARARLPRLCAPTLVIGGTNDAIFSSRRFEELAQEVDGASLELFDGAPHCLNLTLSDQFNDRILRFLEKRV